LIGQYFSVSLTFQDGHRALGKGEIPTIKINSQTIMGNKRVTKVYGLKAFGFDAEELSKILKIKYSTAVSFETSDESIKKKLPELEIHGHLSFEFGDYLFEEYGIPRKNIEITGLKKKKK
jgi:translation initiation factor 1 (eIF-1/SUI1)